MFGKSRSPKSSSQRHAQSGSSGGGTIGDTLGFEGEYSAKERANVLASVPLFARLRPSDRRALAAASVVRSYPAGIELVAEGQRPGVGLYIILQGRVRITQRIAGVPSLEKLDDAATPAQEPAQQLSGEPDWERVLQRALAQDYVRELSELGPGEMFGEMALLDERPRSATATAIEPTLALVIPIVDFRAALARNPDAALWLAQMLSQRVRQAEE